MKNLFEAGRVEEVKQRIAQLRPDSERQWGTMKPAQALEHCSRGVETALGVKTPPRVLVGRLLGWIVKPKVMGNDEPLRRNSHPVVRIDRPVCRGRACGVHHASACLLWAANA
jgi:hypothetical protein